MLLVMIDHYDSFTYNLVQLFQEFDIDIPVFRHDAIDEQTLDRLRPDWVCLSPGPGTPGDAAETKELVKRLAGRVPILGVCLGMQIVNEVFGGRTVRSPLPVHGKASRIYHTEQGIFRGLPSPFQAARYHSLQVVPGSDLELLAYAEDGVIMGLQHRCLPIWGVQFHPESFFSTYGLQLTENFLRLAPGFPAHEIVPQPLGERFPRWKQPRAEHQPPPGEITP
ncbi:Anthranilate synthase component 2 [uncultured Desulfatiglans sp.]|nr:Anthranilate synthase component 2 [uncultured Desulfatiglans sp.]